MTVIPGREMLGAEQRARMQFLAPHASRALLINRAIERKQQRAVALADVVDRLNAGVILLDSTCHIIHSNPAAATILDVDDVLRSVSGRLVARSSAANSALRDIFRDTSEVALAASSGRKIPLLSHDGSYYVAQIIALPSLLRDGVAERSSAVGALFIWKAELDAARVPGSLTAPSSSRLPN